MLTAHERLTAPASLSTFRAVVLAHAKAGVRLARPTTLTKPCATVNPASTSAETRVRRARFVYPARLANVQTSHRRRLKSHR